MRCQECGRESALVTAALGVCGECLRNLPEVTAPAIQAAHKRSRELFGFPLAPPQNPAGTLCRLCTHGCRPGSGEVGYCGLPPGDRTRAVASWYHDPLPTNCVAAFACPGCTGRGHPRYALQPGPEYNRNNLAVFYEACSFDCLYCQNWHYRLHTQSRTPVGPAAVADAVSPQTTCICFFGGDPTPQLPHALQAARLASGARPDGILRICWETNGSMHPGLLDEMVELSLRSGGVIKFDLKAYSEGVHRGLTGVSPERTRDNFARAASRVHERPEAPLVVASTLLVPGYVDEEEVSAIARFIAGLSPSLPYALLAFFPACLIDDLPPTSAGHMDRCVQAAHRAGLENVHIGNRHLLWKGDSPPW